MKFRLLAILGICLWHGAGYAGLGQPRESIASDSVTLKSSVKVKTMSNYSVHEMSSGLTTIREYASNDGIVFAVTWKGMKRPDLSVLLGNYSADYAQAEALNRKGPGRQESTVKTSRVTVRRGGHMRALHGRAYATELIPAGLDSEALP